LARPRPYRGSCSSRRLTNAFCPCAGFRCGNSGRLAMLMAMRGASSRPPGPNGDDHALRGLSLRSVRHDDASVPSFTVNPERYQIYYRDRGADLLMKTPLDPNGTGIVFISTPKATIAIGRSPVDFSKWPPTLTSMAEERVNRRLAAILAADVLDYSRLMGADEEGTLAALKQHRQTIFDPAVAAHSGSIVKLIGGGTIVEFGSVIDAVNCALSVLRSGDALPDEVLRQPKIVLRIGINLGDVIIEGDDIYGDGVNIA